VVRETVVTYQLALWKCHSHLHYPSQDAVGGVKSRPQYSVCNNICKRSKAKTRASKHLPRLYKTTWCCLSVDKRPDILANMTTNMWMTSQSTVYRVNKPVLQAKSNIASRHRHGLLSPTSLQKDTCPTICIHHSKHTNTLTNKNAYPSVCKQVALVLATTHVYTCAQQLSNITHWQPISASATSRVHCQASSCVLGTVHEQHLLH
jgi:hypothetical protein